MAKLSADTIALGVVRPSSSSAFRFPLIQTTQFGCSRGYQLEGSEASTTVHVMQVVGSSFQAGNGSHALKHLHQKPERFLSRVEGLRVSKTFLGLQRVQHAAYTQKSTLNLSQCRGLDNQSSEWEKEEAQWLREEQRWIREEERWLREEARWTAERKNLQEQNATYREEIKALKLEITQLENLIKEEKSKDGTISDLIISLTSLLQSLNISSSVKSDSQGSSFQSQISSRSSSSTDIKTALGSTTLEIPISKVEMVAAVSQPTILELTSASTAPSPSSKGSGRKLKRGAAGDDVQALQEALAKLGFYSGDDDMEHSTFASGTERAVRSWQATLGALENGIVTEELLKELLGEKSATPFENSSSTTSLQGKVESSARTTMRAAPSKTKSIDGKLKTAEVKVNTPVSPAPEKATSKADAFAGASSTRVYLLGENRWEEPDRLLSKNGPTATTAVTPGLTQRCFACKGQGNMMCTECEGTGEPNVEEQFLEWAEGAHCPYCEGKGVLDCDVCDGKGVTALA